MTLAATLVWSPEVLRHVPGAEIWVGVRMPGTELPQRAEVLRRAVLEAGAHEALASGAPDDLLDAVHDPAMTRWLRDAWDLWVEAGFDQDPGQDRVVPYIFPLAELLPDRPPATPAAVSARAVEDRAACRDREAKRVAPWVDHGHTGACDPTTLGRCRLVPPHRRMPQPGLGDVQHRVGRAGRQAADPDSQVSNAWHRDSMPQMRPT